jgi:virulence factor Mce-like protein
MRRLAALLGLVLAAAAVAALAGAPARSADTYRVDAIFDTAKGVIPGQLVKIAGARVGTIEDVRLEPDYKARIVMEVPRRFSFRRDAACEIQPEGLISENFVQCDPGRPSAPPLAGRGDEPPTVGVERTRVPVGLTDLFRIFQADVRQRFTVAVAAVGGGLAARGPDLNAAIVRANPTLEAVRRLTADLDAQRDQLMAAVEDTDRLIARLARRDGAVGRFVEQAARVTGRTAAEREALADAIRRLPGLLEATDPAVARLDRLAVAGRPLLARLRAAAPGLERLLAEVEPFTGAARPALRHLAGTAQRARPVVREATPLVSRLRAFAAAAGPTGRLLAETLVDLRDRGFVENLSLFAYHGAAAMARYDSVSHVFPAHPVVSTCALYAQKPVAGCNAFFGADRAAAAKTRGSAGRRRAAPRRRTPERSQPTPTPTPQPRAPLPKLRDVLPDALRQPVEGLADGLDQTLRGLPAPLRDALGGRDGDAQTLKDLTDFLLGS